MRTLLSFLLSLTVLTTLSAQVKKYTLEECVLIALEKNISIQQSELRSERELRSIDKADAIWKLLCHGSTSPIPTHLEQRI